MPWADLFRWIWQFFGGLLLLVLFVIFLATPHKTNKHADRYWRD